MEREFQLHVVEQPDEKDTHSGASSGAPESDDQPNETWVFKLKYYVGGPAAPAKDRTVKLLEQNAALRVAELLDRVDSELAQDEDPDCRFNFWSIFSDHSLRIRNGWGQLISFAGDADKVDDLRAAVAVYRGLSLFLLAGDRYLLLNARLALFYVTWQWYNAVKRQIELMPDPKKEWEKTTELVEAYHSLSTLLENPDFATSAAWLGYWVDDELVSRPLQREELRLSMVLSFAKGRTPQPFWARPTARVAKGLTGLSERAASPNTPLARLFTRMAEGLETSATVSRPKTSKTTTLGRPLPAPGCMGAGEIQWIEVCLHQALTGTQGMRSIVRRLILDWLLPRYRYGTALRLARLLRKNEPAPVHPGLVLVGGAILLFIISMIFLRIQWSGWWEATLLLLCTVGIYLVYRYFFEPAVLPALALPRVIGGMTLGYAAFVLEGTEVPAALWNRPPLLCFTAVGVVLITLTYLYFDVLPLVRSPWTALRRALAVLFFIITVSFFLGIPASALTALAHCPSDPCPATELWVAGAPSWLLGSQMPLAMLIGIVTQFIWEERTATAPVWSPEEA